MLASAGAYPPFLRHLQYCGPVMQSLLVLLVVAFVFGLCRLWHTQHISIGGVVLILAPTFIGCGLAACQSLIAEMVVQQNEGGLVYHSGPSRYIGYLRIFLALGISLSLILLCVAYFSRQTPK